MKLYIVYSFEVTSSLSYTWNYMMWLASLASPPSLHPICCYSTALCFNAEWYSIFFVHLYGEAGKLNIACVTCLCGLPWVGWTALVSEHGHWKPSKMHVSIAAFSVVPAFLF